MNSPNRSTHIRLTSHPEPNTAHGIEHPIKWGAGRPEGPRTDRRHRSPIRPTATSSAPMAAPIRSTARSRFPPGRSIRWRGPTCTTPTRPPRSGRIRNGPSPGKIVSLDPWGHMVGEVYAERDRGRHSTSVPPSRSPRRASTCRKFSAAMGAKRLKADGGSCMKPATFRSRRSPSIPSGICRASRPRFGLLRRRIAPHPVRADRRHVPRTRHPPRHERVPAAHRQHHRLHHGRRVAPERSDKPASRAASTTSATAPTCSAPISAPAGLISCTASRNACGKRRTAASA